MNRVLPVDPIARSGEETLSRGAVVVRAAEEMLRMLAGERPGLQLTP